MLWLPTAAAPVPSERLPPRMPSDPADRRRRSAAVLCLLDAVPVIHARPLLFPHILWEKGGLSMSGQNGQMIRVAILFLAAVLFLLPQLQGAKGVF